MLLTSGCSVTYGAELNESDWFAEDHWPKTFTHKLAEKLGLDYTCIAKCGNSNYKIFRELTRWFTQEHVSKAGYSNNDKVTPSNCTHMVVLWSAFHRDEIYWDTKKPDDISQYKKICKEENDNMGLIQYSHNGVNIDNILTEDQLNVLKNMWSTYKRGGHKGKLDLVVFMLNIQYLCELHGIKLLQGTMQNDLFRNQCKALKKLSKHPNKIEKDYHHQLKLMLNDLNPTSRIGFNRYHPIISDKFLGESHEKRLKYGHPNAEVHAEYAEYLYNIFQEHFSELNDVPTTSVVFTAADSQYFHMFGTEFVYSFSRMGHDIHVHIVNPDTRCHDIVKKLKSICRTKVTFSHEVTDIQQYRKDGEDDTYYTCARWIKLPEILESAGEVMVLDIDCIARKPFVFPHNENLGFYPRFKNKDSNMKILAGIFYITKEKMELANRIRDSILNNPMEYYVDQIVLHEELKNETEYFKFDDDFCDGDDVDAKCNRFFDGDCVIGRDGELTNFNENSIIWTGKGLLKFKHPQYLELFKYWQKEFKSEGEK